MDPVILAIDNGTQSVRAMLIDLRGNICDIVRQPIEPYFSEQPGWAEQHATYFRDMMFAACQQLWQQTDIPKEAIAGVSVTTQRASVINLDKDGNPLRPAILWMDQRRTPDLPPMSLKWRLLFKLVRAEDMIDYLRQEAESQWIKQHQPDIWEQTDKYVFLSGYLNYVLTGRIADSIGSQVGFMPFDVKRMDRASRHSWHYEATGIPPEKLPDLVPVGETIGTITQAAAEASGIPAGLPVIAGAADKACEVTGSGTFEASTGCLSYGTTATINVISQTYFESQPHLPPYPAAIPGAYNIEVQIYRGYWLVKWFKQEFGHREVHLAKDRDITPEDLFDELVNAVPPGSMGLILQPYWNPGVRQPGPAAKGAIIGFGDVHTRAHVYRAILEGLAYALREGKERLERRGGTPMTELRVSGGGSQSAAAMQLTANVFNLPAIRPHTYETSGLGAAIAASVGLKLHPDFRTAIQAMTHIRDVFEPEPHVAAIYHELYERVYTRLYDRLESLYQDIADITGYPPR